MVSRPSALFTAADRALYRAKSRGGNRVELAGTETRRPPLLTGDVQLVRVGLAQEVRRRSI